MTTFHLIPHTHWDREWYQPFQLFRIRLVHLIDKLLSIMKNDQSYTHFMLDGQTIILEDYLEIRPEKEAELKTLIKEGRILIGPWYILPDEFLVSPEATIRNLLLGKSICEKFGNRMMVGYLPDPFGHISQMPQILNGFNIDTACLRRGLSDEPCELWWQAPDGSKVLLSYLKNGYDNASYLPSDEQHFVDELKKYMNSIRSSAKSKHILLMNGTDHQEPMPETPACIRYSNGFLEEDRIIQSTLPAYFDELKKEIKNDKDCPLTIVGELRDCKRHHLLPGVLSSRMWIKQRNHYCENLLERWAEPYTAWAELLSGNKKEKGLELTTAILVEPYSLIEHAWTQLMKCHPHDTICGCSIDQVHEEMRSRFDQVDQIAQEITSQSIHRLSTDIDTRYPNQDHGHQLAIIAFNSSPYSNSGLVKIEIPLISTNEYFVVVDDKNKKVDSDYQIKPPTLIAQYEFQQSEAREVMAGIHEGQILGMHIHECKVEKEKTLIRVTLTISDKKPFLPSKLESKIKYAKEIILKNPHSKFRIIAQTPIIQELRFISKNTPAVGYRTYWLISAPITQQKASKEMSSMSIENEYFTISVDKKNNSINLFDKLNAIRYQDIFKFLDGGDRGDEYNYNPPENDKIITPVIIDCNKTVYQTEESIRVTYLCEIPESITEDRQSRSSINVQCALAVSITLQNGVPRIDFATEFTNKARDHRFQAHISTGVKSRVAKTDGHFDVIEREITSPEFCDDWIEQPRPEVPQRLFADVSDKENGLMLVNYGLPEVAFRRDEKGIVVIALTLLRSIGWLSRNDLSLRQNAAGPLLETPGAQELGDHNFRFALIPHSTDWINSLPLAYGFENPMHAIVSCVHGGKLPSTDSLLRCDHPSFLITAIKKPEKGKGLIVRGVNISLETITVSIQPSFHFQDAELVTLDETTCLSKPVVSPGGIILEVKAKQIITVRFT